MTWPLNGCEAGGNFVWYRTHCFCCVNQASLMLTRCIYMTVAERSVSKQDHPQPRYHSKARSLSRQLLNLSFVSLITDVTKMLSCKIPFQKKHNLYKKCLKSSCSLINWLLYTHSNIESTYGENCDKQRRNINMKLMLLIPGFVTISNFSSKFSMVNIWWHMPSTISNNKDNL